MSTRAVKWTWERVEFSYEDGRAKTRAVITCPEYRAGRPITVEIPHTAELRALLEAPAAKALASLFEKDAEQLGQLQLDAAEKAAWLRGQAQ